jgi:hypothetical protein
MVSRKSPSLLAFAKERAAGNWATIYGLDRVPCDTSMREILDPVFPEALRPVFQRVFTPWQRGKALESMAFLAGHYFLALDGTGEFASKTMHGASCLHKGHRNGSVTSYHQRLGAAMVHPDGRAGIPLMPEAIVNHDGTTQNDCERHAAKRFVAQLRQDSPPLKFIVTEARRSSHAPPIATLHAYALHSSLGVKEGAHTDLFNQVQAAEPAGRVPYEERHDRATGLVHRFRFVNPVPLNASNSDVRVNFIAYWAIGADRVQHLSWVTDLRVSTRHVYALMRGGRARWKSDNETCNTLKNQGYHFEHNDGHGLKNLSVVFAMVLLALLVDQTQPLCGALFPAVWAPLGSQRLLWERMRALCYIYRLDSMRALFEALFSGFETSRPIWRIASSATSRLALPGSLAHATRFSIMAAAVCSEPAIPRFATL